MAVYLRKMGYSVLLYDVEVENWSYEETANRAIEAQPLLVAVFVSGSNPSASTMNMACAGRIVSLIREMSRKSIPCSEDFIRVPCQKHH